ncbi:MAG: cobalt ABC transporter permease, partial [Lacticaseibacillus paracasei]|nr:cobalt ABC transporter permease [Lacticaseibacillus paracasei]
QLISSRRGLLMAGAVFVMVNLIGH